MAAGPATANRFFARRGRNGAADRTLTLHTTSHTFTKRSVIEQTKTSDFPLSLLRITLVPFVASQICLVIQRNGNFVRATNIFGYPRGAPARFVLPSWISVHQVARQLGIYFSATVYIHAPWKRRGLLWKTHLARELRLGKQFDPRHCRRQLFCRTSRVNKARTLRAAAGVCRRFLRLRAAPECPSCVGARSSFVHPRRGGLEKSGARRAGTKASRSASPSIKRPSTASWW